MLLIASALAAASMLVGPVVPVSTDRPGDPSSSQLSREEAAAQSSRGQDTQGPLPSLYRGVYFHADQERFRLCVGQREGRFTYTVRGGGGGNYFGTYQLSAALARGASWMMAAESRSTHDGLRKVARALHGILANHWNRYWQDRAFYTILNHDHRWSGWRHWQLNGSYCNTLVGAP
ncbi:MAG: hypothetical protein Q8M17_10700 [Actinomycetota bacterium]|nr:hypothetical protein [Actinomycetota bacterium]